MVIAVLLAAGAGSRFTGPDHKLLAELPPTASRPAEPVVARALSSCVEAAGRRAFAKIVLVTGAVELTDAVAEVFAEAAPDLVDLVGNPRWSSGQMSSVRAGLDAAAASGATRAVVGLADQPGVPADAWCRVERAGRSSPIAVAAYDGRRGNPVSLDREVWSLLPAEGDEGARSLMRIRADLVREVPCSGSANDIDTLEDLKPWQSS